VAVTHFAVMAHIVTIFGNCQAVKVTYIMVLSINSIQLGANNPALHRTSKAMAFLPVGKLLVKERYHPKESPFLLLPPVSLVVILVNLGHRAL